MPSGSRSQVIHAPSWRNIQVGKSGIFSNPTWLGNPLSIGPINGSINRFSLGISRGKSSKWMGKCSTWFWGVNFCHLSDMSDRNFPDESLGNVGINRPWLGPIKMMMTWGWCLHGDRPDYCTRRKDQAASVSQHLPQVPCFDFHCELSVKRTIPSCPPKHGPWTRSLQFFSSFRHRFGNQKGDGLFQLSGAVVPKQVECESMLLFLKSATWWKRWNWPRAIKMSSVIIIQ